MTCVAVFRLFINHCLIIIWRERERERERAGYNDNLSDFFFVQCKFGQTVSVVNGLSSCPT
jgi:hypothetical protein